MRFQVVVPGNIICAETLESGQLNVEERDVN